MKTEKYFAELSRILAHEGIGTAPPEHNRLPVLLDGKSACHVEPNGGVVHFPDDLKSPEADELYHTTASIGRMVMEYMTGMEQAPALKAVGLDEDYRLLAEFNGVVLAGRETEKGYGYKFVIWARDGDGRGVHQGDYFMDDYESAKQDFAVRAGLVEEHRLLADEQLTEVYRCLCTVMEEDPELTMAREDALKDIKRQIECLLPDLPEQISQEREPRQELNM